MNISQRDEEHIRAHILNKERSWLVAHPEARLTPAQQKKYATLIKKRAAGVPVQQLLGHAWFFSRTFFVNRHTLIPRPETELLVEHALTIIPDHTPWNVFDIGCGSGCIGITVALERPKTNVFSSDVSTPALAVARKNIRAHNSSHRIKLKKGSLLTPWKKKITAQTPCVILANLPYLSPKVFANADTQVKKYEPQLALLGGGHDGTALYQKLFLQLATCMRASNAHTHTAHHNVQALLIEIEPHQKKLLTKAFLKLFPTWRVTCTKDIHGDDRILTMTPQNHHQQN